MTATRENRSGKHGPMRAGIRYPSVEMIAIAAVALCAIGCDSKAGSSGSSASETKTSDASTAAKTNDEGASPPPVFGTASVRGTVVLEGKPPAEKTFQMNGDRYCEKHGTTHVVPKTEVGKDGGLPHVFVYVKKGIKAKYPPPQDSVELDQTGCMYKPHVFGIQVGQSLTIRNSDNTAHNVHSLAKKNQKFNISQPQAGMVAEKIFTRPEVMVKFKCDVHGWMDAYAGVLNHPFFAVTDANGHFEIDLLPPGVYTIEAWHEMYKTRSIDVTVGEGETKDVTIEYSKP